MDDRSRSGSSDRAWHDYAEQWGHPGTTRGIRGGRRARARRAAYIAAASAEQAVLDMHSFKILFDKCSFVADSRNLQQMLLTEGNLQHLPFWTAMPTSGTTC